MNTNRLHGDRTESSWAVALPEAKGESNDYRSSESSSMHPWAQRIESFLADHPQSAVAVAVAVGVVLGWLGKRK
ncbi:hypothetical protein Pr1d_42630 [Bythopirellula goksoeyrii]|uniref:Uncharacterized protein n=1 Tax=Bythopirellula goksoeyrii TaxID=1400387 RepID=A0A5B9QSP0_9BACT|nr:hypothetical protein Pr1d_42630 [Bythopirellula goksoeyrii]